MKTNLLICFFAFTILTLGNVPQLTNDNFEQYTNQHQFVFVKFFAPWCAYSQTMAPQYSHLFSITEKQKFKIVEVDCTTQQSLCKLYGVSQYPVLKLFLNGIPLLYRHSQISYTMLEWLQKIDSLSLPILTPDAAKQKIGVQTFVLVSGLSKGQQRIVAATDLYDKTSTNYYCLESSTIFIRIYKKGSTQFIQYPISNKLNQIHLQDWIFYQARPSIYYLQNPIYFKKIINEKIFTHIIVIFDLEDQISINYKQILNDWCLQKYRDTICLGFKKQYKNVEEIKKIIRPRQTHSTLCIIQSDLKIGYYFHQQLLNHVNMDKFYQEAIQDKLPRDIDTQKQFKQRIQYNNVQKLTKENYKEVIAKNKIVFIHYYQPNCQECFTFYPKYQQLAKIIKEKGFKAIVAAVNGNIQVDIIAQQGITAYPHFKFFLNGIGYLYDYNKDSQVIFNFLQALATKKINTVESQHDLKMPYLYISGISQNSNLFYLAAFYKRLRIYHVTDEKQFKVKLVSDKNVSYEGQEDLMKVFQWIDMQTNPIFVNLGDSIPSFKLKKAMKQQTPILVVINKKQDVHNILPVLQGMRGACEQMASVFICGFVNKGSEDYDSMIEYIGDKDKQKNRLVYIDTKTFKKYNYAEDPNKVSKDSILYFVMSIKTGIYPAMGQQPKIQNHPKRTPRQKKQAKAQVKKKSVEQKEQKKDLKPADHTVEQL